LHLVTRLDGSVGYVVVSNAPVPMECVVLLRPVMSDALLSSSLVHKVDDGLPTNAHDGSSNNHTGCSTLCHGVEMNGTLLRLASSSTVNPDPVGRIYKATVLSDQPPGVA
jgi:hypothetical protein